jgi:hypothetical protein
MPLPRIERSSVLVFAAALLARVSFFLIFFHTRPVQKIWGTGLEVGYVASSIASGHGFASPFGVPTGPTAWVAPVFTGLVGLLFKIFGPHSAAAAWSVLLMNALFASGTAWAIHKAGNGVFGKSVGAIAAWIWALSPYAVILSIKVWETSLSALLIAVGVLLYSWLRERVGSARAWAEWGLYWGLTALASTTSVILFPFLSIGAAWGTRRWSAPQLALAAVIFCAVLSPWTVRNYVRLHAIFPVRSDFDEELWLGNHEGVSKPADQSQQPFGDSRELALYRSMGERDFMAAKGTAAVEYISAHPTGFARLTLTRIVYFWTAPAESLWVVISIGAFCGLLLALREDALKALPFAVALLIYPGAYYLTHTNNFERHPIEPEMILLAVSAGCSALARLRAAQRRDLAKVGS